MPIGPNLGCQDQSSGGFLFSSVVYLLFLYSYFFLLICLPFKIKNIYSDTDLTMQAGDW